MQQFSALTAFYEAIANDARVNTTHISLYMALLQHWNLAQEINPISVTRDNIMKMAKISARHTYNKVMNELHDYHYIIYQPSSNSFDKSIVHLNYLK